MAHELTHVANRDVAVMTLAGFFATIAAYIVQFGFFFGGGSTGDDDDNPSFMVLLLVSLVVYVVSFLLMQALSRYREFAADRGAAIITGRPSALASALQKISSGMHQIPQKDLRAAGELQAFFIFPARQRLGLAACSPRTRRWRSGSRRCSGSRRSCRARSPPSRGLPRRPPRQARAQAAGARPAVRDVDGLREARDGAQHHEHGEGRDRLPAARDGRLRAAGARHGGDRAQHRQRERRAASRARDDEHGYRWMVIGDPDFEDLVVGVNAVSNEIQGGGYGDRILAAVFAFRDAEPASRSTGSTTTSAAPSTRSCRPAASSSATTSASCG